MSTKIGVVVIGRNEGDRLKKCLRTLKHQTTRIVYVDSGSTDESVAFSQSIGIQVVKLDMSIPFNAGRARNEGFEKIIKLWGDTEFIQFIDGDCELENNWLIQAEKSLKENSSWAIVAGRLKERYPEKSIYNMLCDMEWNTPIGEINSCGGIFLIKVKNFQQINGFNSQIIAGEEPELCYRLRQNKWKIYRLDFPMALHDADITSFTQWWKRTVRSGHSYAQGYALHGKENEKYCFKHSIRIWFWALIVPIFIFLLTIIFNSWWLVLFIAYPTQLTRIAINTNKNINNLKNSFIYAFFIVLGKWPEL